MTPITPLHNTELDHIFPKAIPVTIHKEGQEAETLHILPIPFRKWGHALLLIAEVAPLFGINFDDISGKSEDELKNIKIDQGVIFQALQGEASERVYEFLAFAIDKPQSYFDDMYEEAIDIVMAVITVNVNFFFQRLLPKLMAGTVQLTTIMGQAKRLPTSTNGQK